jgi:hypothetical protein
MLHYTAARYQPQHRGIPDPTAWEMAQHGYRVSVCPCVQRLEGRYSNSGKDTRVLDVCTTWRWVTAEALRPRNQWHALNRWLVGRQSWSQDPEILRISVPGPRPVYVTYHFTRAGPRHASAPGRSIIWRPIKPLFFELFRPGTAGEHFEGRMPKLWIFSEQFSRVWKLQFTRSIFPIIQFTFQRFFIGWSCGQLSGAPPLKPPQTGPPTIPRLSEQKRRSSMTKVCGQ